VVLDCVGADARAGAVQARAQALGLGDRIRFHGLLPPPLLAPFYRSAHLLVLSSRYESQGVVVLEAGAAGLPTVGTAVGLLPTLAPRAAKIQLLVDRNFGAGALVERSRAQGVVLGSGEDLVRMEYVTDVADVKPGDTIVVP
jgi:glycosyltransferase involved in cell wall biosynthesis